MLKQSKKLLVTCIGALLLTFGVIFILLPGPAVIFIPLGLAILSTEYHWAKHWLRRCQRMFKRSAAKLDAWLLRRKYR